MTRWSRWLVVAASLAGCGETVAPVEVKKAPFEPMVYTSTTSMGPRTETVGELIKGEITPGVAISTAMARLEIGGQDIDAIVAALRPHFDWRVSRPGHTFEALKASDGRVSWFRYVAGPRTILHAFRTDDGMKGLAEPVFVKTSTVYVEGEITHSLYLAMDAAGEQPQLTLQFVDLFAWDIDFFTETQKGDRFRLIVEKQAVDGRFVGYGKVLGAEYRMNEERIHRAFFYRRKDGKTGYYTRDGAAVKKAFLKSPIQFASITSRFGMRRHPILKYKRAHRGVDYGAPRGTAIWAIGDGVVKYAGRRGGYGNVVFLRHANGLETRYAHLKGYGKNIRTGRRVAQKQVIGYVGKTGMATGPHLHFEVLRHGRHVNPLRVAVPPAPAIPRDELQEFSASVTPVVTALEEGRTLSP